MYFTGLINLSVSLCVSVCPCACVLPTVQGMHLLRAICHSSIQYCRLPFTISIICPSHVCTNTKRVGRHLCSVIMHSPNHVSLRSVESATLLYVCIPTKFADLEHYVNIHHHWISFTAHFHGCHGNMKY